MGKLLHCAMLSLLTTIAGAAEPEAGWEHVVGGYRHVHDNLAERGISLEIYYSADLFVNTSGGVDTESAYAYRGLLDIGLTAETDALGLWPGGTFFINFADTHGEDLTERFVGDLQVVNNADAPAMSTVYEAWYRQDLFDGRVWLKVGKMDANSDFAGGLFRDEFVHSSAGFSPTIPLPTYPETTLGIEAFWESVELFYAGVGVFDARGSSRRTGFDTVCDANNESFSIVELGLRPALSLLGQANLPGQYSVGGFYDSGDWEEYGGDLRGRLAPRQVAGNYGLYLAFDQWLYQEQRTAAAGAAADEADAQAEASTAEDESVQGLGAFFQFAWSPDDRNEISTHYGAGFQYYGPLPGRDDDVLGVGAHYVNLARDVQEREGRFCETAFEAFYKLQLTEMLSIKPDLQYVVNPGGDGRDALVAGVRMELAF